MSSSSSSSTLGHETPPPVQTPTRSSRPVVSPLFRGISGELNRDPSIDPVVGGVSASKWKEARKWRDQVAERIETEIDEAMMSGNQDAVLGLQREVGFLQILDKDLFFNDLNRLGSPITIEVIRGEIQAKLGAHLQEILIPSSPIAFWNETSLPTSPLTSPTTSPKAKKVVKPLPKSERLRLAIAKVLKEKESINITAKRFGVNKNTLRNRVRHHLRSASEYGSSRCKLTEDEELAILKFIDRWSELGFPLRFAMVKEKALKLLSLRVPNPDLGINWVHRFLQRHPEYKTRFPRHLDQDRFMNTDPKVFADWFALYKRTVTKYNIAEDNVYNMDEKGFLMGVAGNVRYVHY